MPTSDSITCRFWALGFFPLCPIVDRQDALFVGAMGTTEETASRFHTVSNDLAPTMFAFRGQRVNGTFKTVKIMRDPSNQNFNWLVVFVSANFTAVHNHTPVKIFFLSLRFAASLAASGHVRHLRHLPRPASQRKSAHRELELPAPYVRQIIGVGRADVRSPSLRTGLADLLHPALQSVVSR